MKKRLIRIEISDMGHILIIAAYVWGVIGGYHGYVNTRKCIWEVHPLTAIGWVFFWPYMLIKKGGENE